MEIIKTNITVRDLCEGYQNDTEIDVECGVYACSSCNSLV